jgi:hypothetical protein
MAENEIDACEDQMIVDDVKTAGQPLSDFLLQLEDYTPTVKIICTYYVFYYLQVHFISNFCIINSRFQMQLVNIIYIPLASIQPIPECMYYFQEFFFSFYNFILLPF